VLSLSVIARKPGRLLQSVTTVIISYHCQQEESGFKFVIEEADPVQDLTAGKMETQGKPNLLKDVLLWAAVILNRIAKSEVSMILKVNTQKLLTALRHSA